MVTKKIPAIVMLIGGSVSCIVSYLNHYSLEDMLIALVIALLIFFVLGLVIEYLFEKFEIAKEEEEEDDGEVVEKTAEKDAEDSEGNLLNEEETAQTGEEQES